MIYVTTHPALPVIQIIVTGLLDGANTDRELDLSRIINLGGGDASISDTTNLIQSYKDAYGGLPVPAFSIKRYQDSLDASGVKSPPFPGHIQALAHYLHIGVWRGATYMSIGDKSPVLRRYSAFFEETAYLQSLEEIGITLPPSVSPFNHYIGGGLLLALRPTPSFCESSYLIRYPDVRRAVVRQGVSNGFDHFIKYGRSEGRESSALEDTQYIQAFYPQLAGTDAPNSISNCRSMAMEGADLLGCYLSENKASLLICLHAIDIQITFGGMSAFYKLVNRLAKDYSFSHIDLILTDQPQGLVGAYCQISDTAHPLHHLSNILRVHCMKLGGFEGDSLLRISSRTVGLAYNAKAAFVLKKLSSTANFNWIYLVQEDESVFHANSSFASLVRYTYSFSCMPVFNGSILSRYMLQRYPMSMSQSISFEHQYILPQHDISVADKEKILICYFRPESHASRNCYEIIAMALIACLERSDVLIGWEIIGIGALAKSRIPLPRGMSIKCLSKMDYNKYSSLLKCSAVGISLMDAPHPSVVPFEMAGHGITAITNSYFNRSHQDIVELAPGNSSIVICELNHESLAIALENAVSEWNSLVPANSHLLNSCLANAEVDTLSNRWENTLDKVITKIGETFALVRRGS
jgi:hypothetical protein